MKNLLVKMIFVVVTSIFLVNCAPENKNSVLNDTEKKVVDIPQTDVERQSIGNCWVYAAASWSESLHKRATDENFDASQSYWTYMDWFTKITDNFSSIDEVSTGGNYRMIKNIIQKYGLIREIDFVPADSDDEMSKQQDLAHDKINHEIKLGVLNTKEAQKDKKLVRSVLDEAFGLSQDVRDQLTEVFGEGLENDFRKDADVKNTNIINPKEFKVYYTNKYNNGEGAIKNIVEALDEWTLVNYSSYGDSGKKMLARVRRAMHANEPVMVSWFVDFNALEDGTEFPELEGSFNLQTLEKAGKVGRQGYHMTVLEDYEAIVPIKVQHSELKDTVETGKWVHFQPVEIEEETNIDIIMTGTGDADIFVSKEQQPDEDNYDCRPYKSGSSERCVVIGPAKFYVSVNGYETSDFEIKVMINKGEELLKAGITLDPSNPEHKAKMTASEDVATEVIFFRVKNSWGANRDLAFAPGPNTEENGYEKGYHDLYMDYLTGPVAKEDKCKDGFNSEDCMKTITPLDEFILPPGY